MLNRFDLVSSITIPFKPQRDWPRPKKVRCPSPEAHKNPDDSRGFCILESKGTKRTLRARAEPVARVEALARSRKRTNEKDSGREAKISIFLRFPPLRKTHRILL